MEGDVTPIDVSELVKMFEESEDATRDARKLAERDRDYYDGNQLTDAEVSALKKRGQPPVIFNRIQRKVDYLSGLEKQMRKDPKAFPRNPDDEDAAEAATDAIRYVCDDSDWDEVRSAAFDDLQVEGTAIVMVGHKQTKQGIDPMLMHVPWDRYFHDPHSRRPDFDDKEYDGIVTWYDEAKAKRKWPDRHDIIEATIDSDRNSDTYDDRPKDKMWADYKRKRVRVVEMYYIREGQWHRCVFTKSGHLEDPAPSPYMDENGEPENPIKAISLYVNRNNDRYGAVRVLIGPQDEVNKRRSKGLHLITMRQARVSLGSSEDGETIRRELAKPDGIINAEKDDFEILPTADMARGNFEMLQEAKAEIDLLGANAALAGKNENDMSGRAIMAQQQGGMVEVARLFDRLRQLSIEVYRSVWNRIRQFWPHERWVRVTDNENRLRFVGLNQQVTLAQLANEVMQGDKKAIEKATQMFGPAVQAALQGDQQAQTALGLMIQQHGDQIVEVRNAVNELDIDIVIDEGMDTPAVQAEQFDTLAKIMPGIVSLPPAYAKILIQASSLRDKEAMIEALEEMNAPNPMAGQMQQIQMAGAVKELEKVDSEIVKNIAQAESASMGTNDPAEQLLRAQENTTAAFEAETNRIEALKPEQRAA